jgi:SpoVK/Ycf46/Vps4 family AAA+-type ATPase
MAESDLEQFQRLLTCRHPCVSIVTYEEEYALQMIGQAAIEAGMNLWLWTVSTGLRDGLIANGVSMADTENPAAALYRIGQKDLSGIFVMLDLAGHLREERARRLLREAVDQAARSCSTIVLIDSSDELPAVVNSIATRFEISLPDEKEIEELIRSTLRVVNEKRPLQVNVNRKDLTTMVRNLRGLTRKQVRQIVTDAAADDRRFNSDDINHMLALKRRALGRGSLLEYVEAPTDMEQIGGLNRLKTWLSHRKDALTDEATAFGLEAPRGVMMLGVQGAGKSLAAKAIATAWQRPLLRMDVGALYDKYIGESERRLRDALSQADSMAPVILWIDEIEKAFASAASQSTDGGLSKRMFGTLLTWMQEHTAPVFLIATANDIEALPPELLRKGRFDEIFFVDLPKADARRAIFEIHLKKRKRLPGQYDLNALVAASEGFSGAEIEAAVVSGLHDAYAEHVEVNSKHILDAIRTSPPLSVTMREKVEALRQWSVGRCVPAD